MFPSVSNIQQIIEDKASDYFGSLSEYDLRARNFITSSEYKDYYKSNVEEFSDEEKSKVKNCVEKIDSICTKFNNFNNIKWKFAKLCCNTENGFPHTLVDIIFLPTNYWRYSDSHQTETIAHEKIHIYQRQFPLFTSILIHNFWNYEIYDLKRKYEKIRNNPDINSIIYTRRNSVCYQEYSSDNPKSLTDSTLSKTCSKTEKYEHPFEKMAYTIADIISNNNIKNEDYIETLKWMKLYL
jgi:hypothetical protein